ncbi:MULTISPECIES: gp53-like domain-containing protein [Acinetobacter]|uniref:gp53-like domain-containing protein n=1 Tax=Acinetobacter TaxID=469 RepID=UPI001C49D80A|nr:hypothetical protein [Acinetobacter sp. MYb10]
MAVKKLPEFAKNGQKNTDGLTLEDGFPVNLKPARQWFNFLFNTLALAINQIIDEKLDKTANAVSATKLQNKRKIYGQDFDGTSDLSANISFDKVVSTSAEPVSFLTGGSARGVRVANLLVSNSYSDDAKVPLNGAYIKGSINTDNTLYIGLRNGAKDGVFNDRISILPPSHSGVWSIGIFDDTANSNFCIKYSNNSALTVDHNGNFTLPGNVKAPTFIGSLSGNAATTTKLATSRTISSTANGMSASASFDGSGNINLSPTFITQPTATNNTSVATTAFVQAVNLADTGSSATALKLKTARTIGGVLFDGTANINLPGVNTTGNQNTTGTAKIAYLGGINNESSLNAARDSGFYQVNGFSIDGNYSYGILSVFTNGGVTVQIFYPHTIINSVVMITRQTFDNGVSWRGWNYLYQNDSSKLPVAGGTITGNLEISGYISFDKVATRSLEPISFLGGDSAGSARGIRVGNLLVSNSYSDDAKVPTNGAYVKGQLTVDGGISGNASSASKLATGRTIGGIAFDGTANINLPGVNTAGNQNTTGNAATATKLATGRTIGGIAFDGTANINLPGVNTAGNQNTTGNAATATKLANARNIALSGAVSGSANFDGSGNITINTTLNSGKNYQENGYRIHPDGLIEQWGFVEGSSEEVIKTVYFPISFSNKCLNIQISRMSKYRTTSFNDADGGALVVEGSIYNSSFVFSQQGFSGDSKGSLGGTMWRAIGY